MKIFIQKLLIFFLPAIILCYPIDVLLSNQYRKSTEYPGELEVWNNIYSKKINAKLAIYGSSRAWVHFNTEVLEDSLHYSCYNFGMDGHNFWLQYLRHIEYLKNNPAPKLIILSLDFFTLQKRKDLNQPNQFLPFMLWNKNMYNYTASYLGYNKLEYTVPLIRYGGKNAPLLQIVKSIINPTINKNQYRYHGYRGMDKAWNHDFENAKKNSANFKVNIDTPTVALFEQFLKESKQQNIQVILVYSPLYIEGQKLMGDKMSTKLFSDLAIKNDIPFLDYTTHAMCNDKNLFYNATHLNKKGSIQFTKQLISDLNQKQLINLSN